jgi:hypothetical protein
MARRKNASFTGSPLHGGGDGSRELVEQFYFTIDLCFPGSTPVPIPPLDSVHPTHDAQTQAYIFADYAIRKLAPIALDEIGLRTEANKLRKLSKIVNRNTAQEGVEVALRAAGEASSVYNANPRLAEEAETAYKVVAFGATTAGKSLEYLVNFRPLAFFAADAFCNAAKLNPKATWAAANEMLAAL